jgi:acyl-homoserine-lactone acylase
MEWRLVGCVAALAAAGAGWAERVEILRDEFGVPHIFASTSAGAAYASGYAQAEDRLEELLKNYRRAEGTMAEVFGPSETDADFRQRVWRHREVSQRTYPQLSPEIRAMCEAFIAGVARYMGEHPKEAPPWAQKLEPWFVPMLARHMIWKWMEGEIEGKLRSTGISKPYLGSNEWLLAGTRTASGAPIALIDPHLSWYGEYRFYEIRIYAGERAISGAAIVGIPFPTLGHGRSASVAMTTGGPMTSDVYEEELDGGKYRFGGQWKPLERRLERIRVRTPDGVLSSTFTIESTHHGPIVGRKEGKAYSAAVPYMDQFRLLEESWKLINARTLGEAKQALAMLQFMPQNIMVGTVEGDIYYLRNGRVPIRPKGCDAFRVLPGAGACEWEGIHPLEDLVQIANPPQGYMQNCNVSPQSLFEGSPLTPERWRDRPYLYSAFGPANQRARELLRVLDGAKAVDAPQANAIAFWTGVYGAEKWRQRVRAAAPSSPVAALIGDWDGRLEAGSRGALAFVLFKQALEGAEAKAVEPPASLSDERITAALAQAGRRLAGEFPAPAGYGALFRVGREGSGRTWPVGGGTLKAWGMETPRAISFTERAGKMIGNGGQTATEIVVLTRPPQSFTVIPLGESDHPQSRHFDDQAEKLFSRSEVKPTYFLNRRELEKHVERREELEYSESR